MTLRHEAEGSAGILSLCLLHLLPIFTASSIPKVKEAVSEQWFDTCSGLCFGCASLRGELRLHL
ncbi:hypothetical protein E2C01_035975 [Portunus trituberculatus]|uniref:Uncharacterized protein n=1 Tax=Portunus trituberculatus TaxID=210409 RepID=A0A5B7FCX3_PORTR|nr:hypothetical protein [Portunus trituberculatus]